MNKLAKLVADGNVSVEELSEATKLIESHMDVLHASAKLLLEKEKISRDEFEALFEA